MLPQAKNAYAVSYSITDESSCLSTVASLGGSATWVAGTYLECRVIAGDLVVSSDDSLVVGGNSGPKIKLVITAASSLTNEGTINFTRDGGILLNNSTFSNVGTVVNDRFMENVGTINNEGSISGGEIFNSGTVTNSGSIVTGAYALNGGIVNSGAITNSGSIQGYGPIFNKEGGSFTNTHTGVVNLDTDIDLRNDDGTGTIYNFGTIQGDGEVASGPGIFVNDGGTTFGGINVSHAGTFINTNSGTVVINKDSHINSGTLANTNSSVISNFAISLYIATSGTIDNSSTFKNGRVVSTEINTSVSLKLNATDPDGDGLTFSIVTPPLHGVLSGRAPDVIYTPVANFVGVDSFTFKANDVRIESNIATVGVIINDPDATSTGNNGMIAFTRIFGGNDDIFIMNADGTGQKNMTSTFGYFESYPTWSPDGTEIAYAAHRVACSTPEDPCQSIVAVKADGTGLRTITNSTSGIADLAWSPNGTKIAFTGSDGINVVNANGGVAELLVAGGASPSWSPDSMKIAFTKRMADGNNEIFVANVDGTNQIQLTNNPDVTDNYFAPDWSPDGKKIAFARAMPGELDTDWQIYVMNADGTNHVRLTNKEENVMGSTDPNWSPDGTKIVFTKLTDPSGHAPTIAIMNADGTNQTLLTIGDGYLEVSPDFGSAPMTQPSQEQTFCNGMTLDELIASGQYNVIDNRNGVKRSVVGTNGNDLILASANGDTINARGGNDCIIGGDGDDRINGGNGNDAIYAGNGDDMIEGGRGNDTIDGGDGNDRCHDKHGTNTVINCEDKPEKK